MSNIENKSNLSIFFKLVKQLQNKLAWLSKMSQNEDKNPAQSPGHRKMNLKKNTSAKMKAKAKSQKVSENQRSEADRINKLESSQRRVQGKRH